MGSYTDKFHVQGGELIRQITFGMNDGVVSIFALLAGIAGANQSVEIILVTLIAATVAGALSMAAGEYISGKSEKDYFAHEIKQERLEIELCPEIELEELRQIYRKKGFTGQLLEDTVLKISEDRELWVREMVIDELGTTDLEPESSLKEAGIIFIAFVIGASFPTLPYLILANSGLEPLILFRISTGVTLGGLFLAGALKKFVTGVNWFKSGIEMVLVGSFAFGISYVIGSFIPGL